MTRTIIRLLATFSLAVAALVGAGTASRAEAGIFVGRPLGDSSPSPSAALGTLSVSSSTLTRGETVHVVVTGCTEEFQYAEVRLVVRRHGSRVSAVVTSADAGGVTFTVPTWAPTGSASIEASCLEVDLSRASDGADRWRFAFDPVPVRVARTHRVERAPRLRVRFDSSQNLLRVTGSPCDGRILVSVAKGRDRVASSDRLHFGRTLITAELDGTWSVDIPLRYAVSEFEDPVAPGPMTAFAQCEGAQYPAEAFVVPGQAASPAIHILSWNPGGVFVAQCSAQNTLTIVATTQGASGPQRQSKSVPGHEFGEYYEFFELSANATSVTYEARCSGRSGPAFTYRSASVNLS